MNVLIMATGMWLAHAGAAVGENTDALAPRLLTVESVVRAPIQKAWDAWTTDADVVSFGPGAAKIEPRVGGAYEWYFVPDAPEGSRGSEGCRILALKPLEVLSFSWNAPPSIGKLREAQARTQVSVYFEEVSSARTRVRLVQYMPDEGADWDQYRAYFQRAWPRVMKSFEESMAKAAGATESTGGLAPLEPLIGEWTTHGLWEDPSKGTMRVSWERALDGKVLVARSYVTSDGSERQVYETFCAWQPREQLINWQSVSAEGLLYVGTAEPVGGALEFNWRDYRADSVLDWRQTITLKGPNSYEWKVYRKNAGAIELVKEALFERVTSASAGSGSAARK